MRTIRIGAAIAILLGVLEASAHAQGTLDHLKCHRTHDPVNPRATADLAADLQPEFSDSGCKILRAKQFCVPVSKRNVQPPPPDPQVVGQTLSDDYICYKVRCPNRPPAPRTVSDQFGTRTESFPSTYSLCVPAKEGTGATTTIPGSTTTTTLPPCGSAGAPECAGLCDVPVETCVQSGGSCACMVPTNQCGAQAGPPECSGICPPSTPLCLNIAGTCTCSDHVPPAALGTRVFSVANAPSPNGSHFFTSALNTPIEQPNSFVGSLVLKGGAPDETTGVATLELTQDSFIGFKVIDNSFVCFKFEAAGSSGKIDCNGGTPVDTLVTQNSNGAGSTTCGNGTKETGEQCDPAASPTGCSGGQVCGTPGFDDQCTCVTPPGQCGNGTVDSGETCDPGQANTCPSGQLCFTEGPNACKCAQAGTCSVGNQDPQVGPATEQGAAGPAGAGYITYNFRGVNCPSSGSTDLCTPACPAGSLQTSSDCDPEAGKVDYSVLTPSVGSFTTGTATARVTNANSSQGTTIQKSTTGQPFDCSAWVENGPGIVVEALEGLDTIAGDTVNTVQLDD